MKFAPKPENDFAEFIETYYHECRQRTDRIEAIAGKWTFRDLIPGMSDFDTRFIVRDDIDADGWCELSSAVGEVHLGLCERFPHWARTLEHLPGINLTWTELVSERNYYPEYKQWTFYRSLFPEKVKAALEALEKRPWDDKDEYFHLKRLCLYYGRYNRTIDPPINLGIHESKYPLHSRIMHYFNPPVLSAVCLMLRKNLPGKMDAFQIAEDLFPSLSCWRSTREILQANYETPDWYEEPRLTHLEDELERGLARIAESLRKALTLIPEETGADVAAWKRELGEIPIDPSLIILDNAKFARLMKGRLFFYCHAPKHFEATWLIRNELKRIGESFFGAPFGTYWKLKTGEEVRDPATILRHMEGEILDSEEANAAREFARLAFDPCREGGERGRAAAIVEVFDGFYHALDKICRDILGDDGSRVFQV